MREWIALNMTTGIGPRAAARLLERFGSAEAVFGATRAELETLRLRPEAIESIMARDLFEKASEEVGRAQPGGRYFAARRRQLSGALARDLRSADHALREGRVGRVFGPPVRGDGRLAQVLDLLAVWEGCGENPDIMY